MAAVNEREVQPSFDRLWHYCLEEKGRIQSRFGPPPEKDHALAAKAMKGRIFPSTRIMVRNLKVSTFINLS